MDKKFMLVKKIAVPILSVIMLLAQISPTYALTANEIKGLMDQTPSIVLEVYDVPSAEPITVAVAQTTQYFSDVPSNTWYAKDVHEARRLGIIDGVGNNLYKPLENITYAQYLKIISAVLDETVNSKPVSTPWYDRYIDSCRNIGAVGKNEVVPATIAIPREVMIRYTCMALGIEPYLGNEIVFADVKAEDAAYINAAYNEYLTEGGGRLPDGTKKFGFGEYATRAQLASMALRIKAYNENPEAYKAQAAIAREAADAKWEADQAALKDRLKITEADISRMKVSEEKSIAIIEEALKTIVVNPDKTVSITLPDILPAGWAWRVRIAVVEKNGDSYGVITSDEMEVGKRTTTAIFKEGMGNVVDYIIKVEFDNLDSGGNYSSGVYVSRSLIQKEFDLTYSHFKQDLIKGEWPKN